VSYWLSVDDLPDFGLVLFVDEEAAIAANRKPHEIIRSGFLSPGWGEALATTDFLGALWYLFTRD